MPEDIRAYMTSDGREVPCIGTLVREDEILHFSELPADVKFYLDGRDKVMAHLVRLNRKLPADHPSVKAYLWVLLKTARRRRPTKEEFDIYWQRCLASALANVPTGPEAEEAAIWRDPLIMCCEKLLWMHYRMSPDGGPRYSKTLTMLRMRLVEIAKAREWDYSTWRKDNWFHNDLEQRREELAKVNIRLTFDRDRDNRLVVLEYIDPSIVPPENPGAAVTR
jgi:hypothetical protein